MNKKLQEFLDKHNARLVKVVKDEDRCNLFKIYIINGQVVIVQLYTDGGFQVYVPASTSNKLDDEFKAVEKAVGL